MITIFKKFYKKDYHLTSTEEYRMVMQLCCFIHLTLIPFFFLLHILPLAFFNISSAVLYLILNRVAKTHFRSFSFLITYAEIVLHTTLCTLMIGNDFGFQLYVLAIIPISFYILYTVDGKRHLKRPIIMAGISFVIFCSSNLYSYLYTPTYAGAFNEQDAFAIYLYNSLITFCAVTLFSFLFIVHIRKSLVKIEAQNEQLNYYANVDPLTGLLNRRKFTTDLYTLAEAKEHFCILLSDIDDFKKINDTYGHDCGDQMLIHVSTLFKNIFTEPHMICRWGGEEIMVLFKGTLEEGAAAGEFLRATVANTPITYNGMTISCTVTIGTASFDNTETVDQVIISADHKLYEGKTGGKNVLII